MATTLPHVRPGDLITADTWNAVLDWLTELQAAVDALGTGASTSNGPPIIVSLQPTDQPAIGSDLVIIGSGFGLAVENIVTIANLTAVVLAGGGNQLRVRVPAVPGVPAAGLPAQLTVSNPRGFASASIRVMQAVLTVPEGQLFVSRTGNPAALNPGTTADFIFTVRAVVNIAETYGLSPLLTPQANAAQWTAQVLDSASNPISAITIPAGTPPTGEVRQVTVRVGIPNGTNGTSFGLSLNVTSQKNSSLVGASSATDLTVGSALPPPEQLQISRAGTLNGGVDPDGTVAVSATKTRVTYSVAGTQNGVNYTVDTGTAPAGWTASVVGGATQGAQGTQLTIRIDFTPGASAGTFTLRVSRSDDNSVFGTLAQAVRPQ